MDRGLHKRATALLRDLYGQAAQFRPGQFEAIEATLSNRRTLVVQRTGWGKSLVYFIATKLLREQGAGVTLVISPLISLMDNQLEAARGMGLRCEMLNGTVEKELRPQILDALIASGIDLVFTTPETLFSADVQDALPHMRVGLFVIDEAHCISDWGHDFRLEYTRLRAVIPRFAGTPLLATTATATDAVVDDICQQLGGDVYVSRGPLVRDSLAIQVVQATTAQDKYAWLAANLPLVSGSGIVYCTTTHDCDRLAEFLRECGITARAYHAKRDALERTQTLELFNANEVKVLVATSALGMGYDKDDIAFVVHFQLPSGIVAYYQQIGRAGRKLSRAYAILLYGDQTDLRIQEHFIRSAFPTEEETLRVMSLIRGDDESGAVPGSGMRFMELLSASNIRRERLNKALDFLQNDGFVEKDGPVYRATPRSFTYNRAHYEAITARREAELQQMVDFAETRACYSQAVVRALGDTSASTCGHCANCLGTDVFQQRVPDKAQRDKAAEFIERDHLVIVPRKRWPNRDLGMSLGQAGTVVKPPNEEGLCLARVGWGRYGQLAQRAIEENAPFCEELIERAAQVLAPSVASHGIAAVVPVPSLRTPRPRDFAWYLAWRLGLPMIDALYRSEAPPQHEQQNSFYQCANVRDSAWLYPGVQLPESVLLVDEQVRSGWTLAVCGAKLQQTGHPVRVYPLLSWTRAHKCGCSREARCLPVLRCDSLLLVQRLRYYLLRNRRIGVRMLVYNSQTHRKQELEPIEPGKIRMYVCGPTVYDQIHIGNGRTFLSFDVIRRYLMYKGYEVTFAQNLTDVDDKIINRANEQGRTAAEVADEFSGKFIEQMHRFGILDPDIRPRATREIEAMQEMIGLLIDEGCAYPVPSGDVYFSVRSDKAYGVLSGRDLDQLRAGERVEVNDEKRDPFDFALWKAAKPGEPSWPSPWGDGRPGWHTECCAMIHRYLGTPIDIHGGGSDLIFPHHENETAQAMCAWHAPLANVWMHTGMLQINEEKMSKSLGNFYTLKEVLDRYPANAVRILMLQTHYRAPLDFSFDRLDGAVSSLERLVSCVKNLRWAADAAPQDGHLTEADRALGVAIDEAEREFVAAMDDDFNTAGGLAAVFGLVTASNKYLAEAAGSIETSVTLRAADTLCELCDVLGIDLSKETAQSELPVELVALAAERAGYAGDSPEDAAQALLEARQTARAARDWGTADAIRDGITALGLVVEDTAAGARLRRA